MKSILLVIILNCNVGVAKGLEVTGASGRCKDEIYAQAKKYLRPGDKEFEFQGFGELQNVAPSVFSISFRFNTECQGGLGITITALKAETKTDPSKQRYLEATECKVEKITEDSADCG